jgi:hypothetical protein
VSAALDSAEWSLAPRRERILTVRPLGSELSVVTLDKNLRECAGRQGRHVLFCVPNGFGLSGSDPRRAVVALHCPVGTVRHDVYYLSRHTWCLSVPIVIRL